MSSLSPEQLDTISEVFATFDDKGDNRISVTYLGDVVRALGLNPSNAKIAHVSKDFQKDGQQGPVRITLEQFLPIYENLSKHAQAEFPSKDEFIDGLRSSLLVK
ncbi:hypothetical protein ACOME3_007480 [Neoechinorhynchus agilis]